MPRNIKQIDFVNPYNFIPLNGEIKNVRKPVEHEGEPLYSGVIRYSLLTKTPLFIPNTSNDQVFDVSKIYKENKEHKSYDFFSYRNLEDVEKSYKKDGDYDEPVIPGSSIRGMFRSNYEILTDSCLSAVDEDSILSKRTMQSFDAGLLHRTAEGKFFLYKAIDCIWRTKGPNNTFCEEKWDKSDKKLQSRQCYVQKDYPEGCKVYFKKQEREGKFVKPLVIDISKNKDADHSSEGYIIKGERDNKDDLEKCKKHCCHIFRKKDKYTDADKVVMKEIDLKGLEVILQEYKRNWETHGKKDKLPYKEYSEKYDEFKSGDGNDYFPVYYSEINGYVMLSPACKTRELYQNKIGKLIGEYHACKNEKKLCPACALFGTLGKDFNVTSRIRFNDLKWEPQNGEGVEHCYCPSVTINPLSSPKLNNMEFYVKKPSDDAVFWTCDYYIDSKGDLQSILPEINGRKFYWHDMDMKLPSKKDVEVSDLNCTIRPVKNDVKFVGKLFFEKITEAELNQLIWLVNAGERAEISDKKHGYKLGAAKPFGLGSVVTAVDQVLVRELNFDANQNFKVQMTEVEKTEYLMDIQELGFNEKIVKDYNVMTSFEVNLNGKKIHYPSLDLSSEEENGFDWFVKNHGSYSYSKSQFTNVSTKREEMVYEYYMVAGQTNLACAVDKLKDTPSNPKNYGKYNNGKQKYKKH